MNIQKHSCHFQNLYKLLIRHLIILVSESPLPSDKYYLYSAYLHLALALKGDRKADEGAVTTVA